MLGEVVPQHWGGVALPTEDPVGPRHILVLVGLHLGVWSAESIGGKVLT